MLRQTLGAIVLAGLTAVPAAAQNTSDTPSAPVLSVERMLGLDVVNPDGDEVGKLRDILVMESAGVHSYVIGMGGVLGIGDKLVQVAPADVDVSDPARPVVDATREQLEARKPFDPATAASGRVAPIGFGAPEATQAMRDRGAYLDQWSKRMSGLADDVETRMESAGQQAGAELEENWAEVQDAWQGVQESSAQGWETATDEFESAYEDVWATLETGQGADGDQQKSGDTTDNAAQAQGSDSTTSGSEGSGSGTSSD